VKDWKYPIQVQLSVNSRKVTEAKGGHTPHSWIIVREELQAAILDPSPIGIMVGKSQEDACPIHRPTGFQDGLSLLPQDRLHLLVLAS
jgi:hypothetical protein